MAITNNKSLRYAVLVVCIIAFCTFLTGAAPAHTTEFYVNDYADVLSEETEAKILNTAVTMHNDTTAEVVVLTVNSLEGEDISDYAVETLRSWGIGSEEEDNGVLIVLSIEDRKVWVSVGYGLEGTLTDVRTGQLQDQYAVPYYRNDDFETGTLMLFNAIVNEIRTEEYGLEPLGNTDIQPNADYYADVQELSPKHLLVPLAIVIIPFLFIPGMLLFQLIKYACLLLLDKRHGTNRAYFYREQSKITRKKVFTFLFAVFLGRGGRGGFRGGRGGFGGGGGSGGGGGAGRGF